MPSSDEILTGAAALASAWRPLAIAWHGALAVLVVMYIEGWRPSARRVAWLLVLPIVSVGLLAWWAGNPFTATIFAMLTATLAAAAFRAPAAPIRLGSPPWILLGILFVAFGFVYPHFVVAHTWIAYAYASPFGLLPCPTLSLVIGMSLLLPGVRSPLWSSALVAAGLLYGLIGIFGLRVALDWGLLLASATLAAAAVRTRTEPWSLSRGRPQSPPVSLDTGRRSA